MPSDRINHGYPRLQLHRALAAIAQHGHDETTEERAKDRVHKWNKLLENMRSGRVDVGSRVPVQDAPAWLTLEVVTGGFATGGLAAGGELLPFERELLAEFDLDVSGSEVNVREALNYFFISDIGFEQLIGRVHSGLFKITLPEEGALLVAAWLVHQGFASQSADLIAELEPFFSKVRFYPQPASTPQAESNKVYLRDVKSVREDLSLIETPHNILAQNEAIRVWQPFREKVFAFLVESQLQNDIPQLNAEHLVNARTLVSEYQTLRKHYKLCNKPTRKNNLAQAIAILQSFTRKGQLSQVQALRLSALCKRYISKRGIPGSQQHQDFGARQMQQIAQPMFTEFAAVLLARLSKYPQDAGIEDRVSVAGPVSADESNDRVCEGTKLPQSLAQKLERCVMDSANKLIERKVIKSAETLAIVLPQITGNVRASGIQDGKLRGLYAAIYQAFRRRRSLLLLDYQSQVQIEELPWVGLIEQQRSDGLSNEKAAFSAAQEIARMAIEHFPYAIVPNKLLQEFRAIAKSTNVEIPLVDELAADIFMGSFTMKFVLSAKLAADLLKGSVYEHYYQIDFDEILAIETAEQEKKIGAWSSGRPVNTSAEFARICESRSATGGSSGSCVAQNGVVIEQQQILTTQNLAAILSKFDLVDRLRLQFVQLAKSCFERVCSLLQIEDERFHARLIKLKNSAYAWRQMLVFLSLASEQEIRGFEDWVDETLSGESEAFQARFQPARVGLHNAIAASLDSVAMPNSHQQFLGWSLGDHWLLNE